MHQRLLAPLGIASGDVVLTNQHAWGAFDGAAAEQRLCRAADDFLAQEPHAPARR